MQMSEVFGDPGKWARRLAWATAIGLAMGIIGPFGSYLNDGPVMRMAYWTGMFWAGAVWLGLTVGPAWRLAPRVGLPRPFAAALATVVASAPLAAFSAMIAHRVWPTQTQLPAVDFYAQTVFMGGLVVAIAIGFERERPAPVGAVDAPPEGRLPPRLREAALCLQMEDHYVRVHTTAGSELVLTPMRAAVQELGPERGLQVHRSWWVARDAVDAVEQDGRAAVIVIRTGLRVPVARNRIAELRAAGWLPAA